MTHIKNVRPTAALSGKSPHEIAEREKPSIDHLRVLGSTVYVFIHEEERLGAQSKSAKFAPRAQKGMLVGYDGKTIYRVFIEEGYKVVRVKDLKIFENPSQKSKTDVLTYDAIMAEERGENDISPPIIPTSPSPKRGRGRPRKLKVSNIEVVDQHNPQIIKTLITQLETAKSMIDQATTVTI